jgi:N-glycosylase/DNA lyase
VQEQLIRFPGCGRKVADCISLFSLCQSDAIPVDTHVWAIAERDYNPSLSQHASITPAVYEAVGDEFRKRFVRHAGWAHSVLFAAELPEFRSLLPAETQADMKAFAEARAEGKKVKREAAAERKKQKQAQAHAGLGETEDEDEK